MPQKKLTVTYEVDGSPLKKTHKEIGDSTDALGSKFSAVGKSMTSSLEKLGSAFGVNLGPIKGIAGTASTALQGLKAEGEEALKGVEGAAKGAGSGLAGLAGPAAIGVGAVAGLAVALKASVDATASMAGEIRKLQSITGASAEDASRLRHEFVHFGVDADTGGAALVKFSKNLEEGSAKFKGWFTEADLAGMKGKTLIQDLPVLAQKYQSLGTAVEKNTFLIDAFGKGGTALRPILSANAEDLARVGKEADKLGLTFSAKGLADAKAYTMAQRDLGESLKGLEVTLGRAVIPAFTNASRAVIGLIDAIRSGTSWVDKFTGNVGVVGKTLRATEAVTTLGTSEMIRWGMAHLAGGNAAAAARVKVEAENETLQENAAATDAATKKAEQFAATVIKSFDVVGNAAQGQSALTTTTTAMGKADDKAAQDRQKLNDLVAAGVINTKALDAATKSIETTARATEAADVARLKAVDNVTSALKKEADAAKALQTLLGGPAPADQARAEEDVAKAKLSNTEASLALQDAIDAENKLKATGGTTDRQLLDASLAVQKARFGSVDAVTAEKAAEQALYDLRHAADAGSVQRVTLEDNLKAAHDSVTDALRAEVDQERALKDAQLAQADAAKALQVAQAPDEALVKGIADAQRQLNQDLQTVGATTDKVAVTFSVFKAQMLQNITDMTNWAANLQFLMDHNVSSAILDPLAQMGPKAGPLLQQLRNEVTTHGAGAVNDLGAKLTTATQNVQSTLEDEANRAGQYWAQHPLEVNARLKVSLDQQSLTAVGGAIGGALGAPTPKGFAAGGTVPGPYGSPQLILAHGGEEITPLGNSGTDNSGGNTYVVNVVVQGNAVYQNQLKDVVYEGLLEIKRRQGSLGLA